LPGVPSAKELSALPAVELAARLAEAYRVIGELTAQVGLLSARVEELERQGRRAHGVGRDLQHDRPAAVVTAGLEGGLDVEQPDPQAVGLPGHAHDPRVVKHPAQRLDLAIELAVTPSAVNQHLQLLRRTGLVESYRSASRSPISSASAAPAVADATGSPASAARTQAAAEAVMPGRRFGRQRVRSGCGSPGTDGQRARCRAGRGLMDPSPSETAIAETAEEPAIPIFSALRAAPEERAGRCRFGCGFPGGERARIWLRSPSFRRVQNCRMSGLKSGHWADVLDSRAQEDGLIHDRAGCPWRFCHGGETAAETDFSRVLAGKLPSFILACEAPPGEARIDLTVRRRGKTLAANSYPIRVVAPTTAGGVPVTVVGDTRIRAALQEAGAAIATAGDADPGRDLLVIGERALDAHSAAVAAGWLRRGGHILLLQQREPGPLSLSAPLRLTSLDTAWGSTPFIFTTAEPALAALPRAAVLASELLSASPDLVYTDLGEGPFAGEPAVAVLKPPPGELRGTVVGRVPVGQGLLTVCQLPLTDAALAGDPLALALIGDLLRWSRPGAGCLPGRGSPVLLQNIAIARRLPGHPRSHQIHHVRPSRHRLSDSATTDRQPAAYRAVTAVAWMSAASR
jgi:DNA-binding transcriptional ArsR family regulator